MALREKRVAHAYGVERLATIWTSGVSIFVMGKFLIHSKFSD